MLDGSWTIENGHLILSDWNYDFIAFYSNPTQVCSCDKNCYSADDVAFESGSGGKRRVKRLKRERPAQYFCRSDISLSSCW